MTSAAELVETRLAAQISAVNPEAVAESIVGHSSHQAKQRFAMQASTVDIIAMAAFLLRLRDIADRTYDMFKTADLMDDQPKGSNARAELLRETREKIAVVGAALEALGFGRSPPTVPTRQE
ncbi:hypothetical protein [Bradyrhizobium sp. BR 10289]|uniref:hypothetical protein n=1 Tax=Bradyrhizobium sp. BR 10289 TaxID=2749993 RepID=UPI001C650A0B|nr:hypothetical protein [Bradyrhizobium sp. BR 10289]MBW7968150.1 hypothetical protein [Bradyrhizobium sp. BR 10289]